MPIASRNLQERQFGMKTSKCRNEVKAIALVRPFYMGLVIMPDQSLVEVLLGNGFMMMGQVEGEIK